MNNILKILALSCLAFANTIRAAPLRAHDSGGAEHIVMIDKSHPMPPRVVDVLERLALSEKHPDVRYIFNNSAFIGFSARMKSHCLDLLDEMSDVSLVEEAGYVPGASIATAAAYDTRSDATWGLERISTASAFTGNEESLDFTYSYSNSKLGEGTDIYIVDTGVYTDNNIFGGRARMLWSFNNDITDNAGHGTHVAGTAGGDILGVASQANIWGVKTMDNDGGGWSSDVVGGIDSVVRAHDRRKHTDSSFKGSVMSMSLATSSNNRVIDSAIHAATNSGIHVVVAAGNGGTDACKASPASSGGSNGPAITVGAVSMQVEVAEFSNYGDCVDVYAPGVKIVSSWIGSPNMINALTGTSMATPHVTGIVAYAMANSSLAADPALMKEWIRMTALPMSNGLLLANNGVDAQFDRGGQEGFLGLNKIGTKATFSQSAVANGRPVRRLKRSTLASSLERVDEAIEQVHAAHQQSEENDFYDDMV